MLKPELLPWRRDKLLTLLCVKFGNNLASNLFPSLGSILRPNLVKNLVSFLCPIPVQTRRLKLPGGQSLVHPLHGKTTSDVAPSELDESRGLFADRVVLTIPDHYI